MLCHLKFTLFDIVCHVTFHKFKAKTSSLIVFDFVAHEEIDFYILKFHFRVVFQEISLKNINVIVTIRNAEKSRWVIFVKDAILRSEKFSTTNKLLNCVVILDVHTYMYTH